MEKEMEKLLPKFPIGVVLGVIIVLTLFVLMIYSISKDMTVIDTNTILQTDMLM